MLFSIKKLHIDSKAAKKMLFFCLVLLMFFLMLAVNEITPLIADDYFFALAAKENSPMYISSASDFAENIKNHYMNSNGRVMPMIYINMFMILGKGSRLIFNIANSAVYVLMTLIIYFICCGFKIKPSVYLIINLLLWYFVPDYGQVMFWLSGSCNYLFTSVPVLALILVYKLHVNNKIKNNALNFILISFLGFFAGWSGENSSGGMILILLLFLVYYKYNNIKIQKWTVGSIILSAAGFLCMILSPGNFNRLEMEERAVNLSFSFKFCMISYFAVMFLSGLLIIFIISLYAAKNSYEGNFKNLIFQCGIFIISAAAAAFSMLAAPTSPQRTWFIVVIFFIISIGILLNEIKLGKKQWICFICIMTVCLMNFFVMYADTLICSYDILTQTKSRENYIIREREKGNKDLEAEIIEYKYPFLSNHDALYGLYDIKKDKEYFVNRAIAQYYDIDTISGYENEAGFK